MIQSLQRMLHRVGDLAGIDLMRYMSPRHPVGRRMRLFRALGIDLVLDVGANEGQFARELRRWGYRGRIVSFEPLASPFSALRRSAMRDDRWDALRVALGDRSGTVRMNVAGNAAASSSILPILPLHDEVAPHVRTVAVEDVQVRRLDEVLPDYFDKAHAVFLKVDAQGYEAVVLRGAGEAIQDVAAVQLELSLFPLYAGATRMDEMLEMLTNHGLTLVGIETGLTDPRNGYLLQVDGIFARIKNAS